MPALKVMSWNVNGLRACVKKGLLEWVRTRKPHVLGLQEVRARPDEVTPLVAELRGYRGSWAPAERPGYSGVGILTRVAPLEIRPGVGKPEFDVEGRTIVTVFDSWVFINGYFPKGSGKERDNSRVPYKLAFYAAVLDLAEEWRRRGKPAVIGGDFNTAHREIDLRNWKGNRDTSGFLPIERAEIDRWLAKGYVDVFRARHEGEEGHYTWWSQRMGARDRNVGWRIDYLLVAEELVPRVRRAWIEPEVLGSDHCPVGLEIV